MAIEMKDWKWFGNAGHFICGKWCRFHLCTQVGKYLVSSVGQYIHPGVVAMKYGVWSEKNEHLYLKENYPGDDIGYQRKFESMVFSCSGRVCEEEGCDCGMPLIEDFTELDILGCNSAREATTNHMQLCEKCSKL